jgi:hypothetical protein
MKKSEIDFLISDLSRKIKGIKRNDKTFLRMSVREGEYGLIANNSKEDLILLVITYKNFINDLLTEIGYFEEESK